MSIAIDLDLFDQVPEASSASMMPNYSDIDDLKTVVMSDEEFFLTYELETKLNVVTHENNKLKKRYKKMKVEMKHLQDRSRERDLKMKRLQDLSKINNKSSLKQTRQLLLQKEALRQAKEEIEVLKLQLLNCQRGQS